ncbi:hypothetical protein [Methylobacterium oryzihabitans]|uniref:Uncharacterized protein n=1 Tax=Methylobacterium oryzihabitans TaxID=2499852 RepID=A0A437P8Z0_9HYPH|nr:hypothetical protein [Methylobacterium oryzihabitans]RVU18735.1 hypothetical protein EOE48_10150 [Methylobacterium oryzihabitans]
MRRRLVSLRLVSLALLAALAGPALAQGPAGPPRVPTQWEEVNRSMSELLNDGHRIVAAAGPSFTLEKNGKYVACEVRSAGAVGAKRSTTSQCYRLN